MVCINLVNRVLKYSITAAQFLKLEKKLFFMTTVIVYHFIVHLHVTKNLKHNIIVFLLYYFKYLLLCLYLLN